jgi:transposase
MGRQRRRFSADFKTRVALEAIHEHQTVNELASEYGVHPNLIREWKKHLLSELPQVFNSRKGDEQRNLEEERDCLFQQIGQLQYELAMSWPGWKKSGRGPLSNSVWPSR